MMRLLVLTLVVCSLLVPAASATTISVYSSKAAFLADTGAADASGPLPDVGLVAAGSLTVGSVTFSLGPAGTQLFVGTAGLGGILDDDWTLFHPGADIAISSPEDLDVTLAAPVYSLGFDFVEPSDDPHCYAPCFDSTFGVTLRSGGAAVASFTYGAPDDVLAFVGVWSDTAFDRAEIRDLTATIDDEFWGEVYTGRTPLAAPEPGTLALLGVGLAGLAAWRRHRGDRA